MPRSSFALALLLAVASAHAEVPRPHLCPVDDPTAIAKWRYDPSSDANLSAKHPDGRRFSRPVVGESWYGWVDTGEPAEVGRAAFRAHVEALGGRLEFAGAPYEVYSAPGDPKASARKHWWAVVRFLNKRYEIAIHGVRHLEVGEPLTATLSRKDRPSVHFELEKPAGGYLAATLQAPPGTYTLHASHLGVHGAYRREVRYKRTFKPTGPVTFHIDDLPQDPGTYRFELSGIHSKGEVTPTLTFLEEGAVEAIPDGEALGGLLVRGAAYGQVTVEPEGDVTITHPEFTDRSTRADVTPQGEATLMLPAGYWKLRVSPVGYPGMSGLVTRMVPVRSGRLTTLDWPRSLDSVFGSGAKAGIHITSLTQEGRTATVEFRLQGEDLDEVEPALGDLEILDGGGRGEATKLEPLDQPPELVLLLDSSGSMKGQMRPALEAARAFLKQLPPDAYVKVVDFDTKLKVLPGSTPSAVLPGLDQVAAKGATALYDSVLKGLELLRGKRRPTLLLFTDGVDANWNDTAPGSKATKGQVLKAVRDAEVPVFTIGFGEGHDVDTLARLAKLSGGGYFPAGDREALGAVYARIQADLARAFRLTYTRPQKATPSDAPVVHVVVDTSGSMGSKVERNAGLSRLQTVTRILREFFDSLPPETLAAVQTFTSDSGMAQVLTRRPVELRRTLGTLRAGSDTEIVDATEAGLAALQGVPSTNRTFLFFTDAAIQLPGGSRQTFHRYLGQMRDAGIRSLWVGAGLEMSRGREAAEKPFREAATLAGGSHVVTEDPAAVAEAVARLGETIATQAPPKDPVLTLRLTLRRRLPSGKVVSYTGTRLTDFPPLATGDAVVAPEEVHYRFGPLTPRYGPETASRLGGTSTPGRDFVIARRLPLAVKSAGPTVAVEVPEALVLSRLRGLEPPRDRRFLALPLVLRNTNADAVTFEPRRRLFLRQNFEPALLPLSPVTWLAAEPLVTARDPVVHLPPGAEARGTAIFEVRDEALRQLSLHLVEAGRPGLDLPLLGEGAPVLPLAAPGSDGSASEVAPGLTLRVLGSEDRDAGDGARLRSVDAVLTADREARLAADPETAITLAVPTSAGEVVLAPDPATARLPFGMTPGLRLVAGAPTRVRMAYRVPAGLDAAGGTVLTAIGETRTATALSGTPVPEPGPTELRVNGATRTGRRDAVLLVDVSAADTADGAATTLARGWRLILPGKKARPRAPDAVETRARAFGWTGSTLVHDGRTRRGVLAFELPESWREAPRYELRPPGKDAPTLVVDPSKGIPSWLASPGTASAPGMSAKEAGHFRRALARATTAHARAGRAKPAPAPPAAEVGRDPGQGNSVPTPALTTRGGATLARWLAASLDLATLRSRVDGLGYLPGRSPWRSLQEPAATLTQGWGTAGDLARVAETYLAHRGITFRRACLTVTDSGRKELAARAGLDADSTEQLPALVYTTPSGETRKLVSPFMKHLDELTGLVGDEAAVPDDEGPDDVRIRLSVYAKEAGEARAGAMASMGAALTGKGGAGKPGRVLLLDTHLSLPELGAGPVDLAYTLVPGESGLVLAALLDGAEGPALGEGRLDPASQTPVREALEIRVHGEWHRQVRELGAGDELTGTFRTLGINLPDLPREATGELEAAWTRDHGQAQDADDVSALAWLGRGVLARFVAGQTRFERKAAKGLGVRVGRTERPRVLVTRVVTRKSGKAEVSLDLLQATPDLHGGSAEARQAFQIVAGLHAAQLEGAAVPGGGGGLFDAWRKLPEGTTLHWVTPRNRKAAAQAMEAGGLPAEMVERVRRSTDRALLIPTRPAPHAGRARWAWLEVDMESYETVAHFDTGERGSMIEFSIGNWAAEAQAYLAGALVGISASMWSVSAFSLEMPDRAAMLARAKAFALNVSNHFSVGASASGGGLTAGAGLGIGGEPSASVSDGYLSASWSGGKISVGQDMLGFGNGYAAGVEYYFANVK